MSWVGESGVWNLVWCGCLLTVVLTLCLYGASGGAWCFDIPRGTSRFYILQRYGMVRFRGAFFHFWNGLLTALYFLYLVELIRISCMLGCSGMKACVISVFI